MRTILLRCNIDVSAFLARLGLLETLLPLSEDGIGVVPPVTVRRLFFVGGNSEGGRMFASQFLIPAVQRVVSTISMMVHKS